MRSPVALSSFYMRAGRLLAFGLLTMALPSLDGCQGNLDNGIKQISEGSGGDSGSGSGGSSTSTGGTNGTGGSTASGGTTGSGGTAVSTGGTVGTGGTVSTGGTTGAGTGGMASGTGGKAGASGSGGMMAAGGRKGSGGSAGGAMGSGGSGTVATCDAPTKVFKDSQVGCVDIGCHAKGAGNQTPDLQTADPTVLKAYKTTVLCMGGALVVPSNPTSSVLWKVVDGTTCGELMPKGKTSLTQDQEDCLAAWIANIK